MLVDEDQLYKRIGKRLRERRKELGLKQTLLADAVDLQRTSISNIEAGNQYPPLHVIYDLCIAMKLEPKEILPTTEELTGPEGRVNVQMFGEQISVPESVAKVMYKLAKKHQ